MSPPSTNPNIKSFQMAFRSSLSRSVIYRASAFRSTAPLPRLRPPPSPLRRFSFSNPRTMGELGCAQSMLPLVAGVRLTSHLTVNLRAFCELSHGKSGKDG